MTWVSVRLTSVSDGFSNTQVFTNTTDTSVSSIDMGARPSHSHANLTPMSTHLTLMSVLSGSSPSSLVFSSF